MNYFLGLAHASPVVPPSGLLVEKNDINCIIYTFLVSLRHIYAIPCFYEAGV